MNEQPLVSVIMPSYNAERYIAQSIESVLAQTYSHWELLITDDCSTDRTQEIIRSYAEKDERVKLLSRSSKQGAASARDNSIKKAKGSFVAFLDSDDIWVNDKLERQVAFMLENDCAFSYSDYELIDAESNSLHKVIRNAGIVDYRKYLRNTIIGCGSVMINTEKTGKLVSPVDGVNDDMGLWCSVLRKGFKAYPIPEVLYQYRVRNDGLSAHRFQTVKSVWHVYRQQEKLSLWFSLWCFVGYAFNAVKKRLF